MCNKKTKQLETMEDLKRIKNRINWFCDNKINAFSPTISPAPKSVERREIESIYEAVHFFRNHGVKEIVVQRKYMGSYCDIYLAENLEDTYFVSRNGYKIDHINVEEAKQACKKLHERFDWSELKLVIIQSELMPWRVLAKGLIENEFITYLNVHQNHVDGIQESDLYPKVQKVINSEPFRAYAQDKATLSIEDLKGKYPVHIIRQYDSITKFKVLDVPMYRQSIDTYRTQINHFGEDGQIYFKPFNILKKIYKSGVEEFVNDNLSYREINDDECLHLAIDTEIEMNESIEKVYTWFSKLESHLEEGIVIKPRIAFSYGLPPALKVRNDHYLTMIYGMDFQQEYDRFMAKRSIRKKIDCSINDWMLNWEILRVPYDTIHRENYLLKNLVLDRILGEQAEANLDKKL